MADLITIKGGSGDVPTLQDRELAYRKDEKALYIGTGDKNVRLCGAEDAERIDAIGAAVSGLNAKNEEMSKLIENITARLEALETPSE